MFKYLIATCPINGQSLTASDWWLVLSRHKDIDCAETELAKVSKARLEKAAYRVFHLSQPQVGEEFNIKTVRENERKAKKIKRANIVFPR